MANVISIFKKDSPFDKANYRPRGPLPSLSKVYEKIVHQQRNSVFEKKLSPLLGWYSTQQALLNLINKWQSCLDKSRVLGTILMDLSKAIDCLLHEVILAKVYAYDRKSLELLQDYLSNRFQKVRLDSTISSRLEILFWGTTSIYFGLVIA